MNGGLFQMLKAQGQEFFTQLAGALMANPSFLKAMEHALKGKATVEAAAARGLHEMNIPTRSEFKKVLERIDALEAELAEMKKSQEKPRRRPATRKTQG